MSIRKHTLIQITADASNHIPTKKQIPQPLSGDILTKLPKQIL